MTFREEVYNPVQSSEVPEGPWLVVAAHPEDEVFGMGGCLLLARERGIAATAVFLTDGPESPGTAGGDLANTRERDARATGAQLKLMGLEFWHEAERRLAPAPHLVDRLKALIRSTGAAAVFFPSPLEPHPDHRAAAVLAWEAARGADADVYSYEISAQVPANRLIDISAVADEKARLMGLYAAQLGASTIVDPILGMNRWRSWSLPPHVTHAEALLRWEREDRPLNDLLASQLQTFVSEEALPAASPLVSVVVRTKDRPDSLRQALRSVALQSYPAIEVVVINDGIADVEEIIRESAVGAIKQSACLRTEQKTGRSAAANLGLETTAGDFIVFLDDDDWLNPSHVAMLVKELQDDPGAIAAYANAVVVEKDGKSWVEKLRFDRDFDRDRLAFENFLPIHAVLFRRLAIDKGCRLPESLDVLEDWAFWLQVSSLGKFVHVDKVGAYYRSTQTVGLGDPRKSSRITDQELAKFLLWARDLWNRDQLLALVRRANGFENSTQLAERHRTQVEATLEQNLKLKEEREELKEELKEETGLLKAEIEDLAGSKAELNNALDTTKTTLAEIKATLRSVLSSQSWRLTAPLRFVFKQARAIRAGLQVLRHGAREIGVERRQRGLRGLVSRLYRIWRNRGTRGLATVVLSRLGLRNGSHPAVDGQADPELGGLLASQVIRHTEYKDLGDVRSRIKLIAFYLPQFHPIPENDRWWGKGFTEWSNVTRGTPQFRGHYQPKLPGELGFYDLRVPEIQERQVELARSYGIHGFCFYYYWFSGSRLLELPLDQYLANKSLDFPFCICWANENWTRRWDGHDQEILMRQLYREEDVLAFIEDVAPILKDERYIRIEGRPLLLVYRADEIPGIEHAAEKWRAYCRENGIGEICLGAIQSFDITDPRPFGFDVAVEFPPHNLNLKTRNREVELINPEFSGKIYAYGDLLSREQEFEWPEYTLFRGIMPSWDNEARLPGRGAVFAGASPGDYRVWLDELCGKTDHHFGRDEDKLIFVNAWNEWAEGTCLEPDKRLGYGYLDATAEVLRKYSVRNAGRIVFAVHDAHFFGAQLLTLNIIKTLNKHFGYQVELVLSGRGALMDAFSQHATVHDFSSDHLTREDKIAKVREIRADGADAAICNTSVVGDVLKLFSGEGFKTIALIHELPGVIRAGGMEDSVSKIAAHADKVVFASAIVKEGFETVAPVDEAKVVIRPQGLYQENPYKDRRDEARREVLEEFSFSEQSKIILAIGSADERKGVDLFVDVALASRKSLPEARFLWIGSTTEDYVAALRRKLAKHNAFGRVIFAGKREQPGRYYAAADVYLMTSREDPFPSVVMEAMNAATPVIGFDGAGGFKDLLREDHGLLVPYLDVDAMTGKLVELLQDPAAQVRMGRRSQALIEREYGFVDYVHDLLDLLDKKTPRVSVIIPNYNYERYIEGRIRSVLNQTFRPLEILLLDDASTDGSVELAERILKAGEIPYRIIRNTENQGCYPQWLRGMLEAKGDILWIAEADDLCEPDFLETLVTAFDDPEVRLAYSQSSRIDENGKTLESDYHGYTDSIDAEKWHSSYTREGIDEIRDTLTIKNTIPNASAVLMRKPDPAEVEGLLKDVRHTGDWLLYLHILAQGKVDFCPLSLNHHRRHGESITIGQGGQRLMEEIVAVQRWVREHYRLTPAAMAKIKASNQETYEYLGLTESGYSKIEENPAFSEQVSDLYSLSAAG